MDVCAAGDGVELPAFSTIPDILIDGAAGDGVGDCDKTAAYKGQQVTIMYTVPHNQTVSCSRDGYYIITVPIFQ
jgi:hypothetical protein